MRIIRDSLLEEKVSKIRTHKLRDHLGFTAFAFSVGPPERVRFRDHMLKYIGQPIQGYFWGVYGDASTNLMLYETANRATRDARPHENLRAYEVVCWYEVNDLDKMPPQHTREASEAAGFLHLGRLRAAYRKQVLESWMEQLRERLGEREANRHANDRIEDLAIQYPHLALGMLNDKVRVVAHPVRDNFQAVYTTPVWVLTGREPSDEAADPRIKQPRLRYTPDVQVSF